MLDPFDSRGTQSLISLQASKIKLIQLKKENEGEIFCVLQQYKQHITNHKRERKPKIHKIQIFKGQIGELENHQQQSKKEGLSIIQSNKPKFIFQQGQAKQTHTQDFFKQQSKFNSNQNEQYLSMNSSIILEDSNKKDHQQNPQNSIGLQSFIYNLSSSKIIEIQPVYEFSPKKTPLNAKNNTFNLKKYNLEDSYLNDESKTSKSKRFLAPKNIFAQND